MFTAEVFGQGTVVAVLGDTAFVFIIALAKRSIGTTYVEFITNASESVNNKSYITVIVRRQDLTNVAILMFLTVVVSVLKRLGKVTGWLINYLNGKVIFLNN